MAIQGILKENAEYILPVASLAWFVAGVILGRLIPGAGSGAKRSPARVKPAEGMELYIGNLPYDAGEPEVRKLFSRFGSVGSIRIVENKKSGASKGYGFVTMASAQDGRAAIKGLNSQEVGGRRIVVSEARTRARRRRR